MNLLDIALLIEEKGLQLTLQERSILEIHLFDDTRVAAVDHNHLARLYPTLQG